MKTITITEDDAQIIIELLNLNAQTDEDYKLIDKLNKLVNDNYPDPDPKTTIIKRIQKIINDCGDFSMYMACIENEDSIIVNQTGNTSINIDSFGYDGVDCSEYVNDIETSNPSYDYEDLSLEILESILYLAEIVETDFEKTQKRCK